jgi:hypothetical protein
MTTTYVRSNGLVCVYTVNEKSHFIVYTNTDPNVISETYNSSMRARCPHIKESYCKLSYCTPITYDVFVELRDILNNFSYNADDSDHETEERPSSLQPYTKYEYIINFDELRNLIEKLIKN